MNTRNEKKAYAHFEFWKIANFRLVRYLIINSKNAKKKIIVSKKHFTH